MARVSWLQVMAAGDIVVVVVVAGAGDRAWALARVPPLFLGDGTGSIRRRYSLYQIQLVLSCRSSRSPSPVAAAAGGCSSRSCDRGLGRDGSRLFLLLRSRMDPGNVSEAQRT